MEGVNPLRKGPFKILSVTMSKRRGKDSPWPEIKGYILNLRHFACGYSMDGLDDEQRRAVHLLQEISNTTDDDVAVGVLSSVDWDIQVIN